MGVAASLSAAHTMILDKEIAVSTIPVKSGDGNSVKNVDESAVLEENICKPKKMSSNLNIKGHRSSTSYRTIRVYVSSVFREFSGERLSLSQHCFPAMERLCNDRHVTFVAIDLRLGLTPDDIGNSRIHELCLREIDSCHVFLGLLGEQYGWSQAPLKSETDPIICDELLMNSLRVASSLYPWLEDCTSRSLVEIEIMHALLNSFEETVEQPRRIEHCVFLQRTKGFGEQFGKDSALCKHFSVESPVAAERMKLLIQRIKSAGENIISFHGPDDVADIAMTVLGTVVDKMYPLVDRVDFLTGELRHVMHVNAMVISEGALPRTDVHEVLDNYLVSSTTVPLAIVGASGAGKTTAVCSWLDVMWDRLEVKENTCIIYIDTAGDRTTLYDVLSTIYRHLHKFLSLFPAPPHELREMISNLPMWIRMVCDKGQRLLVVIDSLDDISTSVLGGNTMALVEGKKGTKNSGSRKLTWLPTLFPDTCRVIVTVLESSNIYTEVLNRNWSTYRVDTIPPGEQRAALLSQWLTENNTVLSSKLKTLILAQESLRLPMFLTWSLSEIMLLGAPFRTDDDIRNDMKRVLSSSSTVTELVICMFIRMEKEFFGDTNNKVSEWQECAEEEESMKDTSSVSPKVAGEVVDVGAKIPVPFKGLPIEIQSILDLCGPSTFSSTENGVNHIPSYVQSRLKSPISRLMMILCVSKRGLRETEIMELLGLTRALWAPIKHALCPLIIAQHSGFFVPSHPAVRQAVNIHYGLQSERLYTAVRRWLCVYFEQRKIVDNRSCDEYPWLVVQMRDWVKLSGFLSQPKVLQIMLKADRRGEFILYMECLSVAKTLKEVFSHTITSVLEVARVKAHTLMIESSKKQNNNHSISKFSATNVTNSDNGLSHTDNRNKKNSKPINRNNTKKNEVDISSNAKPVSSAKSRRNSFRRGSLEAPIMMAHDASLPPLFAQHMSETEKNFLYELKKNQHTKAEWDASDVVQNIGEFLLEIGDWETAYSVLCQAILAHMIVLGYRAEDTIHRKKMYILTSFQDMLKDEEFVKLSAPSLTIERLAHIGRLVGHIGFCYLRTGDLTSSVYCYDIAVTMMVNSCGKSNLDVAKILEEAGMARWIRGDTQQALALLKRAYSTQVTLLGGDRIEVAMTATRYGWLLRESGSHLRADTLLKYCYYTLRRKLGLNNISTAQAALYHGLLYSDDENTYQEAHECLKTADDLLTEYLDQEDERISSCSVALQRVKQFLDESLVKRRQITKGCGDVALLESRIYGSNASSICSIPINEKYHDGGNSEHSDDEEEAGDARKQITCPVTYITLRQPSQEYMNVRRNLAKITTNDKIELRSITRYPLPMRLTFQAAHMIFHGVMVNSDDGIRAFIKDENFWEQMSTFDPITCSFAAVRECKKIIADMGSQDIVGSLAYQLRWSPIQAPATILAWCVAVCNQHDAFVGRSAEGFKRNSESSRGASSSNVCKRILTADHKRLWTEMLTPLQKSTQQYLSKHDKNKKKVRPAEWPTFSSSDIRLPKWEQLGQTLIMDYQFYDWVPLQYWPKDMLLQNIDEAASTIKKRVAGVQSQLT